MSNRLSTLERVPLTLDFDPYRRSVFRDSRSRAEYVMELGRSVGGVLRSIGRAFTWIGRRIDEARAMRELALMDDRMLADIGLKRSDIPLVVSGGARPTLAHML